MLTALLLFTLPVSAEFHIGLYNLTVPDAAEEVAAAGFTHVLTADPVIANAALSHGLSVVGIPPGESQRRSEASPVAAWYIADEPEINRQSREDIARIAAAMRRWDPGTPLTLVVGDARYARVYAPSVDVLMVDWYPVPHLPLGSVGDQVTMAVSQAGGKPIWAVLQAMDWKDYPQRDPKKPRIGRFPTHAELRFMTYHAVLRGASGVYYFEFQRRSVPGKSLLDYPERWQALKRVVGELSTFKAFFAVGPGESMPLTGLEGRRWQAGGRSLAVLLNPTPSEVAIPKEFLEGPWKAFASSPIDAERSLEPTLGPWQVAVLTGP